MTIATKPLTDTQMLVLAHAKERANLFVLPLPPSVKARGSVKRHLLTALLKLDMIQESAVDDVSIAWRTDEAGKHYVLHLTPRGFLAACPPVDTATASVPAITSPPEQPSANDNLEVAATSKDTAPTKVAAATARAPAGKLGQVLQAISGDAGATLTEITTLTGWLPHTARAALTGLRQRGFAIELVQAEGRKAYRHAVAG